MSRSASEAYRQLESANIALEDVIVAELAKRQGSVKPIIACLNASIDAISELRESLGLLRNDMKAHAYNDLPTFWTMKPSLADSLSREGLVDRQAWNEIIEIMTAGTFFAVLDEYENRAIGLSSLTRALANKIAETATAAERGELHLVLEQNRFGNFKVEFARLYTAWGRFDAIFLAGSLLTTELWYKFTGCGSLLNQSPSAAVA